jgi:hypothetical protein
MYLRMCFRAENMEIKILLMGVQLGHNVKGWAYAREFETRKQREIFRRNRKLLMQETIKWNIGKLCLLYVVHFSSLNIILVKT